ncbi:MAG: beta-mannosidase, partial [Muribaculaceae bacterium]|nr:beta-mannosidase [Muribaculaceae bacterium]
MGLIVVCAMTLSAQGRVVSLNSLDGSASWTIKPKADLSGVTGEQISTPGYEMADAVSGLVPGTVFASYVEAGLVANPEYGDNIYLVPESDFNRPFWYRTEFDVPSSFTSGKRLWLHFDNTNRFADFYFNGKKLSGTAGSTKDVSGHMIRTRYDVTDLVK